MNVTTAKDYIKHIFSDWSIWRTHHRRLEEATTTLLTYIRDLEEANTALAKCLMRADSDIVLMDKKIDQLQTALGNSNELLISYMRKVGDLV